MKQRIEIELEIPEGYEATGEYRTPKKREYFSFLNSSEVNQQDGNYLSEYIILRKKEPEQPQYKSFLIDWDDCRIPIVEEQIGPKCFDRAGAKVGMKVGDYRIFGFGSNQTDDGRGWHSNPCHRGGNYKYAYGRLEK